MEVQRRHAIGLLLRRHLAELSKDDSSAIVGVYRRPGRVALRGLSAVQNALGLEAEVDAYAQALPGIARRLSEGLLHEAGIGWCAVAFVGERHGPADAPRVGTAVLSDGAVGHLSWQWGADATPAPAWRLFEDGAEALDAWVTGLSMILAALTGESARWGGAA
jgi:hypothetical protein